MTSCHSILIVKNSQKLSLLCLRLCEILEKHVLSILLNLFLKKVELNIVLVLFKQSGRGCIGIVEVSTMSSSVAVIYQSLLAAVKTLPE